MVSRYSAIVRTGVLAVGLLGASLACAVPITADFETLADTEILTTQIAGLTFSSATALKSGSAGGSLNDIDFPPHSGVTVVYDSSGPMAIDFAAPIESFAAYFTHVVTLTLSAFDGATLLGSVSSATDFNAGGHELLQIGGLGSITRVTIAGAALGGSFTMDALTAVPVATTGPVPVTEPSALILVLAGLLPLAAARRRRKVTAA